MKSLSRVQPFATPWIVAHCIFQARVLEWVAISFSRGSSWLRDQTQVSCRQRLYLWATRESLFRERVFANVIKLRISRQGDYPGWSERALNAITSALVKERKEIWHTKRRQCEDTGKIAIYKDWEMFSFSSAQKEPTLLTPWSQISKLQSYEKIDFCCLHD